MYDIQLFPQVQKEEADLEMPASLRCHIVSVMTHSTSIQQGIGHTNTLKSMGSHTFAKAQISGNAESAGLRVRKFTAPKFSEPRPLIVLSMASSKPADLSQTKKKDNEKEQSVANGVKKDDTEELVHHPVPFCRTCELTFTE